MGEFERYRATLSDYELLRSANCCRHAFEHQQSKIEQLEKRVKEGLEKIDQFEKEGCLFPEWLYWAKKALRGECE